MVATLILFGHSLYFSQISKPRELLSVAFGSRHFDCTSIQSWTLLTCMKKNCMCKHDKPHLDFEKKTNYLRELSHNIFELMHNWYF